MLVHIDRHRITQILKCSYMGTWDILELSYFIKNVKVKGDDFCVIWKFHARINNSLLAISYTLYNGKQVG